MILEYIYESKNLYFSYKDRMVYVAWERKPEPVVTVTISGVLKINYMYKKSTF